MKLTYNYLQMAAYCDQEHLLGSGQWLRAQAEEERSHAMRFFEYVLERGNEVRLAPIGAPAPSYESMLGVFTAALQQERRVSQQITDLYRIATEEQDFATFTLLQWFVNEQVEEEGTIERITAQLEMIGDDSAAPSTVAAPSAGGKPSGRAAPSTTSHDNRRCSLRCF